MKSQVLSLFVALGFDHGDFPLRPMVESNIPRSLLRAPSNGVSKVGEHPLWSHAGLIPRM